MDAMTSAFIFLLEERVAHGDGPCSAQAAAHLEAVRACISEREPRPMVEQENAKPLRQPKAKIHEPAGQSEHSE